MTVGELLKDMQASEASPHSNGRVFTVEEVLSMDLRICTIDGRFTKVLSVYPNMNNTTMFVDIE